MNKQLLNFLKFLLFLGVGLSILYFVYLKYNTAYLAQCEIDGTPEEECNLIGKIISDFKSANFFWIFIVLVAFTISNLSRAARWNMLIRPMGYKPRLSNAFFTIIVGYFANLGLPRIGEVIRAATMSRYEKIPVEKLVGTIVVGRTVDVLCFASAIGIAFLIEFDKIMDFLSQNQGKGDSSGGGLMQSPLFLSLLIGGIILFALFFIFKKRIVQTRIYQKVINTLKGLWEGVQTIRKLDNPVLFILHSINIWVMYYLMTYLCFFAFEPTSELSPVAGLMAFVFGAFGILIPSPGGMGTYHFFTSEALMIYGLDSGDAFSFANILFFSIQLGCNVLVGILSLLLLPLMNREYRPQPIKNV